MKLSRRSARAEWEKCTALDTRLGREVAVKVLPASFSADRDRLQRFEREARAAGALHHPNILAIYDVGTHNGSPFLVSELLEGETLCGRLKDLLLPLRKTLDYAVEIAKGLGRTRSHGEPSCFLESFASHERGGANSIGENLRQASQNSVISLMHTRHSNNLHFLPVL